jgi:peptide/nickel transport system substrate-binding protein
LGSQAEQRIERHLLKRFERLIVVRRFVIGWLSLLALIIVALIAQNLSLSGYYQTVKPAPGGIYNEGVLGRFTNANPIYAVSEADATVSRLIFAGLFTYDNQGKLVGDLARDYDVDKFGKTYTVHLKPNLKWQDGQPLTSADVAFTFRLVQNPDVQSPLRNAWQGIVISTPDPDTVVFKLPDGLAPFPYSLTTGIVPEHLLSDLQPADLRSADFNTIHPVGAGPFAWQAIEVNGESNPKLSQQQIALTPFEHYQGGPPKLLKFVVQVFADKDQLIEAFAKNQLTGLEGLTAVPKQLHNRRVQQHNLPLRAATMVFFKTSSGVLADSSVRRALVGAANVPDILKRLDYPARAVREPILPGQVGYNPKLTQAGYNLAKAKKILDKAGWKIDKEGIRHKHKQSLAFTLTTADTPEYHMVTRQLQQQWRQLGVKLDIQFLGPSDFQSALNYHSYDAILYGIAIGPDPDVFVYWDSSQADIRSDNRLNLSEYKNPIADAALEAGRTRLDPRLRAIKYKPFLEAWRRDAPALGLYQPRALYLTNGPVAGLGEQPINTVIDRLNNVHNWQIREARVTN